MVEVVHGAVKFNKRWHWHPSPFIRGLRANSPAPPRLPSDATRPLLPRMAFHVFVPAVKSSPICWQELLTVFDRPRSKCATRHPNSHQRFSYKTLGACREDLSIPPSIDWCRTRQRKLKSIHAAFTMFSGPRKPQNLSLPIVLFGISATKNKLMTPTFLPPPSLSDPRTHSAIANLIMGTTAEP